MGDATFLKEGDGMGLIRRKKDLHFFVVVSDKLIPIILLGICFLSEVVESIMRGGDRGFIPAGGRPVPERKNGAWAPQS